ncbi:hypothetical protein BH09MYX1_BH09MYX1_37780 [soil metagenome]
MREALLRELSKVGFRVAAVPDGSVAVELLELRELADGELHALVLDVRMPEVGGVGVLQWLRGDDRSLAAVLISGCTGGLDVLARELSAVVLAKPFTCGELVNAIERARELQRERQAARNSSIPFGIV